MTLASRFADFASALAFDSLPPEVARIAGLHLLDTVGVCFASIGMDYADAVLGVVEDQGECADATLFGRKSGTRAAGSRRRTTYARSRACSRPARRRRRSPAAMWRRRRGATRAVNRATRRIP